MSTSTRTGSAAKARRGGDRAGRANGRSRPNAPPRVDHGVLMVNGSPAYVLVPVEEYERLILAEAYRDAARVLDADRDNPAAWEDSDQFALELAGSWIAEARKNKGWTQVQLARKLGVPQSQVSRIERRPDHTTMRTLKRVARALGVDLRGIVH